MRLPPQTFLKNFTNRQISRLPENSPTGHLIDFNIPEYGIDINSVVENMERNLILKALKKTGGVKNRAAKLLGLNRTTLIEKMKKMRD